MCSYNDIHEGTIFTFTQQCQEGILFIGQPIPDTVHNGEQSMAGRTKDTSLVKYCQPGVANSCNT